MQLVVTRVSVLRAFSWIKNGWRLFTQRPGPFMAMAGILMSTQLIGILNQFTSIIVVFLLPFLTIGFYQVASKIEQGEQVAVSDIFQYLGRVSEYRVLLRISLLSVLLSIPASIASTNLSENILAQQPPELDQLALFVFFLGLNFMVTAFALPAAWVSPQTPLMVLVIQSIQAGWQNVVPMTIYGVLMLGIWMISTPVILIGWLIALSVSHLSFYHAFLEIFQPVSSPVEKGSHEQADDVPEAVDEETVKRDDELDKK